MCLQAWSVSEVIVIDARAETCIAQSSSMSRGAMVFELEAPNHPASGRRRALDGPCQIRTPYLMLAPYLVQLLRSTYSSSDLLMSCLPFAQ